MSLADDELALRAALRDYDNTHIDYWEFSRDGQHVYAHYEESDDPGWSIFGMLA